TRLPDALWLAGPPQGATPARLILALLEPSWNLGGGKPAPRSWATPRQRPGYGAAARWCRKPHSSSPPSFGRWRGRRARVRVCTRYAVGACAVQQDGDPGRRVAVDHRRRVV